MEVHEYPRSCCILKNFLLDTETYSKLCKMPGFNKWEGRELVFRPTAANLEFVLNNFPDARWQDSVGHHLRALEERNRLADATRAGKLHLDQEDGFEYRLKPYAHQRTAFLLSRDCEAFALLMEQRTGKTKVIIDNAAYLWRLGRIHTLIVVSVNGVHRNWVDNEIPKHMPEWCPYRAYFQKGSHTKAQQALFQGTIDARETVYHGHKTPLRIFTFNIEGFSRGAVGKLFNEAMGDGKGVMLAIDESTRIRNKSAARSKFLIREGARASYRRILTGTPVVHDPTDVFAQFYFLNPDILGYDTMTSFKARYCITKTFNTQAGGRFEKLIGTQNIEELARLIDGYSFRVLRKDCMDLPPKVYKRLPVDMAPEQWALYNELNKEYIAEFQGHTCTAAMAMTRALRLQQILSNWWPMEEEQMVAGETWRKVIPISKVNPRLAALENIITGTDDKVIVWSRFRPDLELIQGHFGKECVSYHGGVREDDRARNYKRFQTDRSCRIFNANPASAGLGLELSVAGTAVYYSNSWDAEHRWQSEDRTEGPYKNGATQVIDLEVVGTVDSKVIKNLKGKKDIADLITGDPVGFFMEG